MCVFLNFPPLLPQQSHQINQWVVVLEECVKVALGCGLDCDPGVGYGQERVLGFFVFVFL